MTDDERLAEIRERLEAATPGEWRQGNDQSQYVYRPQDDHGKYVLRTFTDNLADAKFLAHSRSDTPWLLDKVAEQAKEIERLRTAIRVQDSTVKEFFGLDEDDD